MYCKYLCRNRVSGRGRGSVNVRVRGICSVGLGAVVGF